MGIVSISLSQNNNMKFLLVVAVAAYVKAEADPAFVYSTAGVVPSVYTHGVLPYAVHHPLVYAAPLAAGCQNDQGKLVPCAHGALPLVAGVAPAAAEPVEAVESVEKREAEPTAEADAEADPEADPWLLYSGYHGYGYGHYAPFTYSYAPHVYSHAYSYYGLPHAYYYGKRSADAELEADANADADAYYGYYGYGLRPYGYRAYGYGYPYKYGYYGKRSADAEADPAVFYNAYGYGAFGAYPYGLGAYAGYGAAVLPYGGIAATNNVVGHAVAYTPAGVTHSSNVGVCTNFLGAQVPF